MVLLNVHIPLVAVALMMMMMPMVVDGISQFFGFRESNNVVRLLTGLMFTFGLTSMLVK
jgi:uncharacterized membrane protein